MESLTLLDLALPVLLLVAGVLVGLLLEKGVLTYLKRFAARTRWPGDEIILSAFRGIFVFWGVALGIYAAIQASDTNERVEDVLEKVLVVALLSSVTIIAARLGAGFTAAHARRQTTMLPAASIISNLVRLLIYITGILIILDQLNVAITPIVTALGVGGLAVALALQDTLSNVFAGLYLIAARQFKPGDYIKLDSGEEGYINDINWRSTTVRTLLSNMVIVPNTELASSIVTNYHLPQKEMLVLVPVAVDYESDLDQVERVTLEVAKEALQAVGAEAGQEPYMRLHTFGEFSLNFTVVLRVREFFDQYYLRHVFMKKIVARYRQEGIRIPFPIKEFEMQLSTGGLEAGAAPGLRAEDAMQPVAEDETFMRKSDPGQPGTRSG